MNVRLLSNCVIRSLHRGTNIRPRLRQTPLTIDSTGIVPTIRPLPPQPRRALQTDRQLTMDAVPRLASVPSLGPGDTPRPDLSAVTAPAAAADVGLASLQTDLRAPFPAIGRLFDHLRARPDVAAALNATYATRGVFKSAASSNGLCDQKLTIDLSPARLGRVPPGLQTALAPHGFDDVVSFFRALTDGHLRPILAQLGGLLGGVDLARLHRTANVNFRIIDYTPDTAAPLSANGCAAHRDYGTFSIIFQDGTAGLEVWRSYHGQARLADGEGEGEWVAVPAEQTVILCGWSAFILSGGRIQPVRHRVVRQPGVRRLSAVLFVAPDLDVVLQPITPLAPATGFSDHIRRGQVDVRGFKEAMGKRWRYREGNEDLLPGDAASHTTQDQEIKSLILG